MTARDDLKAQLFGAFASRPAPAAGRILRSGAGHPEGDRLRELLAAKTPAELTDEELRTVVESGLSMLTREAFLHFLPAFLWASLASYDSVSIFASELLGALTEPDRADVVKTLDRLARAAPALGLPDDVTQRLHGQQLEHFDSGRPTATFHERFDDLTHAEGAAILAFLVAFQESHGEDFPFDEIQIAIDRRWSRYRAS
ncbi:MAG TPA: hypothetical protein VFF06_33490 [Polyangia bacterium]|nr:hypothetical protein [Polyangia bacterium]